MPPITPTTLTEAVHDWAGLSLLLVVLLTTLAALGLPLVRLASAPAGPDGAGRGARTALLLVLAFTAIVAAELFTPMRGWLGITLLAAVLVAGIVAVSRGRRAAALREEATDHPPEPGMTAGAWCVAALLGFVAAVTVAVAAFLFLGGDGFMEMLSIQVCAVLAAVVVGDLSANLLLRLRTRTRRAELRPRGLATVLSRPAAFGVLTLTALVAAGAFAVAYGEHRMAETAQCYPGRDLAVSHAPDTIALGMIGIAALATTALGAVGVAVAAARPAIASLDPVRDHALRRLSAARTLGAVVAAQLVLAADLVPGAAYAFLPVDPSCSPGSMLPETAPEWLPGPHLPGAVLVLVGVVVAVAACVTWAAASWWSTRRALADFGTAGSTAGSAAGTEPGSSTAGQAR